MLFSVIKNRDWNMKFSEEYLFNCISVKKYFRIPIASADTYYFINDGSNSVVKVQDQKLCQSWTLEHPHCFTSFVTFCPEEDSLFCVLDNTTLVKWSINDDTLKKAANFQFQENIFAVLPLHNRKPVILFSSGKVLLSELLYISQNPIGKTFVDEEEELVWADAHVTHSEIRVLCLALSKNQKTYRLHHFSIKKEETINYTSQVIENAAHSLKDWCLNKYNLSFVTIWSNGVVLSHHIQNKTQSTLLTLTHAKNDNLFAISVLDSDHVVVAIKGENKKETILEMWDTKFTSLKAKKVLKTVPSECQQLYTINFSIFLLSNDNLIEIPYDVEKSTLATAIGKSLEVSSKSEYSWIRSTKATVIFENNCNVEKEKNLSNEQDQMDTDDDMKHTRLLAQRFMEEGSAFKTNNRESDLLELLRFALRAKRKKKAAHNFEPDALLNAVFTSSFREAALVQYVRKLNLVETLISLQTLLDFLEEKITLPSSETPSDLQLFDWVFIIIKSHTEALLLSKDKKKAKLLKRLDRCLSEKIGAYEDYVNIQNLFYMLQKKENILPTKHVVGKYFIETIDI